MGKKKYRKPMKQINLKAPIGDWNRFGRLLEQEGVSRQEWFNGILAEALKKRERS
jgi:hypothetical protein